MGVAGSRHPRKKLVAGAATSTRPARRRAPPRSTRTLKKTPRTTRKPLVFTIPSDSAATRDVQKRIMERVEAAKYGEQQTFAIRLALEEGLMNAIKHGNKNDKSKRIHIEAKVTARQAEIVIEDEGSGFRREAIPDPCADENLLKCSGRGLLLMEAYMDKVQYTRGGRRVKMVKKK